MGNAGDIVANLEQAARDSGVLGASQRLLLAVSGGQDSVAMALALHALTDELDLHCEVAHVNHGTRGDESDADGAYVRGLCERLGMACHVERVDAPGRAEREGMGLEEAARLERFAALRQIAEGRQLDGIALAHTATDRAETILMNILRGCGLRGLAAMGAESGDLIRPLLSVTRDDTAAYCMAKGAEPRQDGSNEDETILRNRIRRQLLPEIETSYAAGATNALLRLAGIVERELTWTDELAREAHAGASSDLEPGELGLAALGEMPEALRLRVLRAAIQDVRGDLRDIGLDHLSALDGLVMTGQTGNRAELPGIVVDRTSESVVLKNTGCEETRRFRASLHVPGCTQIPEAGMEISSRVVPITECEASRRGPLVAQLDGDAIGRKLVARCPEPGDRMQPLGMAGTKKLHDVFVDRKIPRADREGIPVVQAIDGEIVWLVGHYISERAKVTESTGTVIELYARPLA